MKRWLLVWLLLALSACGTGEETTPPAEPLDILPGADVVLPEEAGPTDAPSDEVEPEVEEPATPGLGLDYENLEPGVTPRYEIDGDEWTATPWPSDRARTADGRPDLSILPNSESQLWQDYLAYADEVLDGFGLNSAIYFEFDGLLDLNTLPEAHTTLTDPKAVIQLVNVTTDSPRYGQRIPVNFDLYETGDDLYYLPNTLGVRPVFGYPMAEGETYCALITRGVTDAEGLHLQAAEEFQETYESDTSLAPLRAWLPESLLLQEDLAVATCLTTSDATGDMRRIRAFLEEEPLPTITELAYMGSTNTFHEFEGEYVAPNFQQGEKPYEYTGGDFVFDEDGDPVIQLEEPIKFLLMLPTGFKMPDEGWPIVLYGHGTGGDHTSCKASVAPYLVLEALATVCIDLPLHGARGDPDWDVEFLSFNFLNPRAGRTNFRQAAIDIMSLARMVSFQGMDLDADTVAYAGNPEKFFDEDVRFDPEQVHYFGHSHGGLSGAIAFGVEPRIISGVLSGAGGGFTETVLRRKDIVDFAFIFTSLMKVDEDELDAFHPALTMLQTLVDATDPLNYSPYWLSPAPGGRAKHIFITCGTDDAATPYVTTTAMAAAGGIPMLEPVAFDDLAHDLKGLEPEKSPVTLNVVSSTGEPLTGALRQWDGWDHFVAFDHPEARAMWQSFFRGIRYGQSPIIGVN